MEELVQQVKILTDTIQTMIARSEQLSRIQQENAQVLAETATNLKTTIANLEVTDEALKQSLDDSDRQIDDLAKVTAALLAIQQAQNQNQNTQ